MKIGIVLSTNDPEGAWNAFRFGLMELSLGHQVKTFLLGKAVEIEDINDPQFNVIDKVKEYLDRGGELLVCSTCLVSRNKKDDFNLTPPSTMKDMADLVNDSDKVVTFG
jgi:uncharacterized protein involved in oxidation of intracellular sulfur